MWLPTNKEELVKKIVYLFHSTRDELTETREQWRKWYDLYSAVVDETYPLPFKIFIPWSSSVIETIIPRVVNGLLFRNPLVQLNPGHPTTPFANCESAGRLMNKKWFNLPQFYSTTLMMAKECCMYGSSFGFIHYVNQNYTYEIKIPTTQLNGKPLTFITEEVTQTELNQPMLEHFDLFDVFPDLRCHHMRDCKYIITACIKDMDEIRHGDVDYENLDALEEAGDWEVDEDWKRERLESRGLNELDATENKNEFFRPRLIITATVKQYTKKGLKVRVIYIGNESIFLGEKTLNYWPWVHMRNVPMPHEFLGLGESFFTESLQHGINDYTNIFMTNALMSLTKMWIVGDEADADLDQFVLEPFNIIQVANPDAVRDIAWKGIDSSSERAINMLESGLKQASGIHDYMQGVTPQRREYATTVAALQQAGEARIDQKIKLWAVEFITMVAITMLRCAQNHMTSPAYLWKEKDVWDTVEMNQIMGLMDVEVVGSSTGMNELKRAALTEFAKISTEILGDMMPIELRYWFTQKIGETFDTLDGLNAQLETALQTAQGAIAAQNSASMPIDGAAGMASPNGNPASPQGNPAPPVDQSGLESIIGLL